MLRRWTRVTVIQRRGPALDRQVFENVAVKVVDGAILEVMTSEGGSDRHTRRPLRNVHVFELEGELDA